MTVPPAAASAAAKEAAIQCWTADPCGTVEGEAGTSDYADRLVSARRAYAPWMAEILGYDDCAGLDVLDVGCGQGIDLIEFARGGARVVGVDLTPRHVELAGAHLAALGLRGEVLEADAERLPLRDGSFDRACSNGVLHHTPEIDAALREIHRVLRPGGEVRIVVYNRWSLYYWLVQVLGEGLVKGKLWRERSMLGVLSSGVETSRIGARPLVRVFSRANVRDLLVQAGFVDVRTLVRHFRVGGGPYGRLAARIPPLRSEMLQERIARAAGWYVAAIATRP